MLKIKRDYQKFPYLWMVNQVLTWKNREKKIENSYTVKKSVNLKKMFMGPGSRSELNGS